MSIMRMRNGISIHALREEGDLSFRQRVDENYKISIHALREEGDVDDRPFFTVVLLFLSTPSARRATCFCSALGSVSCISIHALREEGDFM